MKAILSLLIALSVVAGVASQTSALDSKRYYDQQRGGAVAAILSKQKIGGRP